MAQTKKKRRTKHRGNAAGVIETRGRTGRKPTAAEGKASARDEARARREARANRVPTWRSAFNRAAISAVLFVLLVLFVLHQNAGIALAYGVFVLAIYTPLSYYFDQFIYKRKLAKQARSGS